MEVRASRDVRVLAALAGAFPSLDTAVNIAFPAIDEHFSLDVGDLQWIVVCYLFTYGVLLVAAGHVGDAIGHQRLVWFGAAVSVVGLAGCAAASTYGFFLMARVVQGVGTALVLAGAPALLTTSAEAGRGQGRAVSWFQAAAMAGLAIGPIVGGPLVALGGWRAVFWFRIPLALALLVLAHRVRREESLRSALPQTVPPQTVPPQTRSTRREVRTMLVRPGFVRANALTLMANAAMFPVWLLVPTLLVDEIGLAVVLGGLVLASSPALSAAGSLWVGRRVDQAPPAKLAQLGLTIQAAGLVALAVSGPRASVPVIVASLMLVGVGLGVFSVPNMHQVMSSLPHDRQGVAGGLSLMMRTIGVVAGVLAASALFDPIERSEGFSQAFRLVFLAAAVLSVIAAIASTSGRSEARPTRYADR